MSEVNDLSLNLFYGDKTAFTAAAASSPPTRDDTAVATRRSNRKRPRSYPTPVPTLPSFDDKQSSSSTAGRKKYVKPAPLYDFPKLKPREQSLLPPSSLLLSASALSDATLFAPTSFPSFAALPLSPRLVAAVTGKLCLTAPTRIQALAIPSLVQAGRDAIIRSNTGTGKTLAYLLPLLQHLTSLSAASSPITRRSGPLALILLPTRELCLQTFATLSSLLLSFHWLVASTLMGGDNRKHEKERIRRGVNIIVATPGRLVDHLDHTHTLSLAAVQWLVLDEADRLLDLGFEREVGEVLRRLAGGEAEEGGEARRRQTVLLSATMGRGVVRLSRLALQEPLMIGFDDEKADTQEVSLQGYTAAGSAESEVTVPDSITHHYLQVETRHRLVALAAFLRQQLLLSERKGVKCKSIVFLSTCNTVDFHHLLLTQLSWPPPATTSTSSSSTAADGEATALLSCPLYKLHGDMEQKERTAVFHSFAAASTALLLCTDVAARGLDLPAVDWIVQYDVAEELHDYVHRVGRCGRIGQPGSALIFLTERELPYMAMLPSSLTFHPLTLPPILASLRLNTDLPPPSSAPVPAGALLQRLIESMVSGSRPLYSAACRAYQSWVRAYAGHSREMKAVFHVSALHLGHVCRSFGLGDEPTRVAKQRTATMPAVAKSGAPGGHKRDNTTHELAKTRGGAVDTADWFKRRKVDSMAEFAS